MPCGVPHCKIAFDPENDLWYYEIRYPGDPIHDQACVYPTPEAAQLSIDPQRERIWEVTGEGLDRVLLSTAYVAGSVGGSDEPRVRAWQT
jgi:hypothetical protein